MKFYEVIPEEVRVPFWTCLAVALSLLLGLVSIYVLRMGNDNPIEEAAEDFVEHVSGIKIDLSEGEE